MDFGCFSFGQQLEELRRIMAAGVDRHEAKKPSFYNRGANIPLQPPAMPHPPVHERAHGAVSLPSAPPHIVNEGGRVVALDETPFVGQADTVVNESADMGQGADASLVGLQLTLQQSKHKSTRSSFRNEKKL